MNVQNILLIFLIIVGVIVVIILLKEIFSMIFNNIRGMETQVENALSGGLTVMKNVATVCSDGMKEVITLSKGVINATKDGMKEIITLSGAAVKEITTITFGVISSMSDIGSGITREISSAITSSVNITKDFGKSVIDTIGKFGLSVDGITDHMKNIGDSIMNSTSSVVQNLNGVKDIVNTASELGNGVLKPVVELARANVVLSADMFKKITNISTDTISTLIKPIGGSIENILKVATTFSVLLDSMIPA